MNRLGFVQVGTAPEQQALRDRLAEEQRAWREAHGFVPVPAQPEPGRLFCGHVSAAIVREGDGTEWCGACGDQAAGVVSARRP